MPTSFNPDTGEAFFINPNGEWEPTRTSVNPDTKQIYALDGQNWVEVSKPEMGIGEAAFKSTANIADAMLFGAGSEIAGIGGAVGAGAQALFAGEDVLPAARRGYEEQEAAIRASQEEFAAEQPIGDIAGKITGALAGGPMKLGQMGMQFLSKAPTLGKIAGVPALGAAEGAITGALMAPPGERGEAAVEGGAVGLAVGAALPVAGKVLKKGLIDPIAAKIKPRPFAENRILKAFETEGLTPQQAMAELDRMGPQAVLADVGEGEVARLARAAAAQPGAFSAQATRTLRQRAEGVGDRIIDTMRDITGARGDYYGTVDDLFKGQKAAADVAYAKAREAGANMTPKIQEIMKRPTMVEAMERAKEIASIEGRELPEIFVTDSKGVTTIAQGVDLDVFDHMKRGLDAIIEPSRDPITKTLNLGDPKIKALNDLRRDFVEAVDAANPLYKKARMSYAGPARQNDALLVGRRFLRGDPEALEQRIGKMTTDEKASFMEGVARSVQDMVDMNMNARNVVNNLLKKPGNQKKLRAAFGNEKEFLQFKSFLRNEAKMAETAQTVLGGSPTARIQEDVKSFFLDPDLMVGAAEITAGRPVSGLARMAKAGLGKLTGPSAKEAQQLEVLISSDLQAAKDIIRRLEGGAEGLKIPNLGVTPAASSFAGGYLAQ